LADFTVGFFLTAIGNLFLALVSACGYFILQIDKARQRRWATRNGKAIPGEVGVCASSVTGPSEKTETERDAVEVLVSLGMPRRASERRVAGIIEMHGVLPIEELLRKALN